MFTYNVMCEVCNIECAGMISVKTHFESVHLHVICEVCNIECAGMISVKGHNESVHL